MLWKKWGADRMIDRSRVLTWEAVLATRTLISRQMNIHITPSVAIPLLFQSMSLALSSLILIHPMPARFYPGSSRMIPKYTMRSQHSKLPSLEHSAYLIIMSPCLSLGLGSMKTAFSRESFIWDTMTGKPKLPMQLISAVQLQHSIYNFCCLISSDH